MPRHGRTTACTTTPVQSDDLERLVFLFEDCLYDRVLIDSALEGRIGTAFADSAAEPTVARSDSGAFTMLAGKAEATQAREPVRIAPIQFVTPRSAAWRRLLEDEFGARLSTLRFADYSPALVDLVRLEEPVRTLPSGCEMSPIEKPLAEKLTMDLGNVYFFENFHSIDDSLRRGVGYCVLHEGRIVSAATSMAQCARAVDIEIETAAEHRDGGTGVSSRCEADVALPCSRNRAALAGGEHSLRAARLEIGLRPRGAHETLSIS